MWRRESNESNIFSFSQLIFCYFKDVWREKMCVKVLMLFKLQLRSVAQLEERTSDASDAHQREKCLKIKN